MCHVFPLQEDLDLGGPSGLGEMGKFVRSNANFSYTVNTFSSKHVMRIFE